MPIATKRELELERKLAIESARTLVDSYAVKIRGGGWLDMSSALNVLEDVGHCQPLRDSIEYLELIDGIERHPTMPNLVRLK